MVAPVALLAEASHRVGMGHLMEVLAVRTAADAAGLSTRLVVNADAPLSGWSHGEGAVVRVPDFTPSSLRTLASDLVAEGCRAVVTDLRSITSDQLAVLAGVGLAAVCLDELGGRRLDCEAVINTSIVEAWHCYTSTHPRFRLYTGPRYLPLARDYGEVAAGVGPLAGPVRRVVVSLGGADPSGATAHVLEALGGVRSKIEWRVVIGPAFSPEHRRRIHDVVRTGPGLVMLENVPGLARVLADADLIVTAGGNTLYECACLGIPALVLWEAPHERAQAEAFERAGFGRTVGQGNQVSADAVLEAIAAFDDPSLRQAHGARGRRIVDGLGAERVCAIARGIVELGVPGKPAPAGARRGETP